MALAAVVRGIATVGWLGSGLLVVVEITRCWPIRRSRGFWTGFKYGWCQAVLLLGWPVAVALLLLIDCSESE